jgi:membrane-associated phospholipid phosphatase
MLGDDLRNSAGDVWSVWTSPFRATGRDWLAASGVIALAAAVSPFDAPVDRWVDSVHHARGWLFLDPVRENGAAFSGRTITPVASGLLVIALADRNARLQEGLFGCLSAYAATSAVRTFAVYPLVARTRPDRDLVIPGAPPDSSPTGVEPPPARQGDQYRFSVPGTTDWGRHSLPGGHIANVVACASFLTKRFSMGAMTPVSWAVAGGVGAARMLDRRHWLSDQVLGALFGYAAGRAVAARSSHRVAPTNAAAARRGMDDVSNSARTAGVGAGGGFFLAPMAGGWTAGWRRTF